MIEYTYSNLIIDPTKEGIESLIGKEVYFHNNPSLCLENANEGSTDNLGILVEIFKNSIVPFRIEQKCGTCAHTCAHACIIEKKEEPKPKPKYVPFESMEKFIEKYRKIREGVEFNSFEDSISRYGIWLKYSNVDTDKPIYRLVSEIRYEGIKIPEFGFLSWEDLIFNTGFVFIDGTPCGKEVK